VTRADGRDWKFRNKPPRTRAYSTSVREYPFVQLGFTSLDIDVNAWPGSIWAVRVNQRLCRSMVRTLSGRWNGNISIPSQQANHRIRCSAVFFPGLPREFNPTDHHSFFLRRTDHHSSSRKNGARELYTCSLHLKLFDHSSYSLNLCKHSQI
jgi:hypothetical protein